MLRDRNRAKAPKNAEKQEEEGGINEIAAVGVTEFGTGQLSQRGREIAPGIRVGNWVEREPKALPRHPGKNERKGSPVTGPPKRPCSPPGRLIACAWCDHFQGFRQCLK